ncbi:MAG: tripartite tricarboxylate transporter substrate binding protein [Alphaproteobacteria bacterium]|nr:tripartite tricarboxylate transporter substrate binding protein [Alphaproteobacteria bacterium]
MNIVLGRLILLACLLACEAPPALAQTYPNRTVTIVVTSAAGALTDALTRAVAQRLSQMWGQSIIVENRGGAGHNLAAAAVKAAAADGYTLLSSETGFATSQPHLHSKSKSAYDPETDFIPVAGYAGIPIGVLVNPSLPVKSMAEFIAVAKQKPLTYGTAGLGTAPHTAALLLESMAGIKMTAVHYRGAAPALNDLIAGHINMITMGPSVALPAVKDGKINILGFGSEKRVAQYPDVPTVAETVPGYEAAVSFGLFALKTTPRDILIKINTDIQNVIHDPEFHKRFLESLVVQPIPGSLDAFAEYLRKDSAKWAQVINAANLKID